MLSQDDTTDGLPMNSHLFRNIYIRPPSIVLLANVGNLFVGEFGERIFRSRQTGVSAPCVSVFVILGLCPETQMFGVDAVANITLMENIKTVDVSLMEQIRNAMCECCSHFQRPVCLDASIPRLVAITDPEPAIASLVYSCEEVVQFLLGVH